MSVVNDEDLIERACIILYFVEPDGNWFKAIYKYEPYFYIACNKSYIQEMSTFLEKKFEKIASIEPVDKVDLDQINHLTG